jgi:cyclopropane fatty-acyl-phospholipid synthase-like methyltransferase
MATDQQPNTQQAVPTLDRDPVELKSKDNLVKSYLRIFRDFRRHDLIEFCEQHDEMYREALRSRDHLAVTKHYYGLMADVIETYYGDGWHFCPPAHKGQSRADATIRMYDRVSSLLDLQPGKTALDLGCGVGGMLRYVARQSGANITGITLGENEVEQANQLIAGEGLDELCNVV